MKRFYLVFLVLALLLVFAGCGQSKSQSSATAINAEFFNRKIEGEITISAYDSMLYKNYLEEAARLFEALYPGTKVNIETFSAMPEVRSAGDGNMMMSYMTGQDDPQARTDYISRVNTNIMSGTGADIYAIDVIPIHKFAQSGTLENLDLYMNNDPAFNKADYRQNILNALRYRDGIWFLPMDYTFNYYAYDSTLIPENIAAGFGADKSFNAEDLFRIGMPLYSGGYKLFNSQDYVRGPGGMFNQLLGENIQSFVNLETGRANFTDGNFSGLLESVRSYSEHGYIPRGVTGQQQGGPQQMRQPGMSTPTERYHFKLNGNSSLIGQFTRGLGMIMRMISSGSAASIDDDDEIAGIQAYADGSVPFGFNQGFGINSQSKNKETAWAFLKFLLSDEMQMSTNLFAMGFPINNKARADKAELTFSGSFMGSGGVLNAQQREAMEAYKAAVERLSDSINTYVVQDTSINDMISQEVQYYFGGSRSANEVASALQNKANLYLSE